MIGNPSSDDQKGLIPRSFQHIMSMIDSSKEKKFLIRCSYIEIYNEEIRDLLSPSAKCKKDLKENADKGIFVMQAYSSRI